MLFSVRMKMPDRIGIDERGTIRCTPFEGRNVALRPAGRLLEQPVRGDADGDDRVPSAELERAPGETVLGAYADDPARLVPNEVSARTLVATDAPWAAAVRATYTA